MPLNFTISTEVMSLRADDLVRQALVVTFCVVKVAGVTVVATSVKSFRRALGPEPALHSRN